MCRLVLSTKEKLLVVRYEWRTEADKERDVCEQISVL